MKIKLFQYISRNKKAIPGKKEKNKIILKIIRNLKGLSPVRWKDLKKKKDQNNGIHIFVCIEENRITESFCIWHSKEYIFLHSIHYYGQSFLI